MTPSPRNTARPVAAALLALSLTAAGCSSGEREAGATQEGSAPRKAAATRPERVELCDLMPVADVAATLQANGVEAVTEQKPGGGGMCSYLHVPKPGDYKVKLLIDFTRAGSADKAKEGFQMRRKDFEQRGMRPIDAGGLGDEAFVTEGQGDTEGLKVRSGAWIGQINLTVDGRAPATLRPAVLALGKQVLQRLPR